MSVVLWQRNYGGGRPAICMLRFFSERSDEGLRRKLVFLRGLATQWAPPSSDKLATTTKLP
jgi:hypothetical protein